MTVMAAPDEPRLRAIWSAGLTVNGVEDLPPYPGAAETFIAFINRQAFWLAELYLGESFVPFRQLMPRIALRPLVLVAGGLDPYEADFNRAYAPLLGESGSLWVIESARHVGGLTAEPEAYRARMIGLFNAALMQ